MYALLDGSWACMAIFGCRVLDITGVYKFLFPSWAASLYAVWIGSRMVLTDVVF
jgi:hypothetical protein